MAIVTVTESVHKALLLTLFYVSGTSVERRFPLSTLPVAVRCLDKIKYQSRISVEGGNTTFYLMDGDVDLDSEESKLLRDLIDGLSEATPSEYRLLMEVRQLLGYAPIGVPVPLPTPMPVPVAVPDIPDSILSRSNHELTGP